MHLIRSKKLLLHLSRNSIILQAVLISRFIFHILYCFCSTLAPHFVDNDNLSTITSSPWSYFHANEKLKPQTTVCTLFSPTVTCFHSESNLFALKQHNPYYKIISPTLVFCHCCAWLLLQFIFMKPHLLNSTGTNKKLSYVVKGLEAVLDKAVHTEDGKKITRYGYESIHYILYCCTIFGCFWLLSLEGLTWRAWTLDNGMLYWYSAPFVRWVFFFSQYSIHPAVSFL